jgi:hypothetical protein
MRQSRHQEEVYIKVKKQKSKSKEKYQKYDPTV